MLFFVVVASYSLIYNLSESIFADSNLNSTYILIYNQHQVHTPYVILTNSGKILTR
jgi:hypothetical protein